MQYKYLVCPGNVLSQEDGQWHWVSAQKLIELYGVDPRECLINRGHMFPESDWKQLIKLYPDAYGYYELSIPSPFNDG